MEKKIIYILGGAIILVVLLIALALVFLPRKSSEKINENWCEKGSNWQSPKIVNKNVTITVLGKSFIENEKVCLASSRDNKERYAFNGDESKIWKFSEGSGYGKPDYGWQLLH
jgi:hypothetical protein